MSLRAQELAIAHRQNRQSTVIAKEATELMSVDAAVRGGLQEDAKFRKKIRQLNQKMIFKTFLQSYEVIFMSRGKVSLFDPDHQEFIR